MIRRIALPGAGAGGGPCQDCGNEGYVDGYCANCGMARAEPDRDEAQLDGIALITDRGLGRSSNEDAAAAGALDGGADWSYTLAAAVCDGVSSSPDSRRAASAASNAGVERMLSELADSRTPEAAMLAGLADAAAAASAVGDGVTPETAPSCTYTAVIVVNHEGSVEITVGNVGDSRAYWLPRSPEPPVRLTVDDTMAQKLIAAGASPDSPEVLRYAHVLTRWLGHGADTTPWSAASLRTMRADGAGVLLMCTDGLWNYFPEPADVAAIATGESIVDVGRTLVDRALEAGGHDNVTVALIPIGEAHEFD